MHRFYSSGIKVSAEKIILTDKQAIHRIVRVSRIKIGERIALLDETGNEYTCRALEFNTGEVVLELIEKRRGIKQDSNITVACAIPKKVKMDDIVDKLTQLGVDRIIPLKTERVVVKLDKLKESFRLERWRKISLSASLQSQRNKFPCVDVITTFKSLLSGSQGFDLKLIPTLCGERKKLKDCLERASAKNILVLIGPEGDFTDEEVSQALKAGFQPVTLGDLVLRVDTAAIAVASFIRFYYENH
jgi:16S rRNA (uracil1498-N3)-methyltransferase